MGLLVPVSELKTNILVLAHRAPEAGSKATKAAELGIELVDEQALVKLLAQASDQGSIEAETATEEQEKASETTEGKSGQLDLF